MPRFGALDGWRGAACLLVILVHLPVASVLLDNAFLPNVWPLVDFFFILSGFVITHTYLEKVTDSTSLYDFSIRRVARMWPLHLFVLSLFVVMELLKAAAIKGGVGFPTPAFAAPFDLRSLLINIPMLHAMGLTPETSWNFPSWSIAGEFWTYIVFGIVVVIGNGGPIWRLCANALAVGLILIGFGALVLHSPDRMNATYDLGFMRCLMGFFTGYFVYQVWTYLSPRLRMNSAIEILMLIGAVLFIIYAMRTPWEMATPLVFAFFVFVFAFQGGVISRLLLTRPVQWLGEHSYTIYMVHAFIITNAVLRPLQLVQKLFKVSIPETPSVYGEMPRFIMPGGEIGAVVVILTYTAMVLLAAALTFRFVEKPAQKALIRLLAARKQAAHSK